MIKENRIKPKIAEETEKGNKKIIIRARQTRQNSVTDKLRTFLFFF